MQSDIYREEILEHYRNPQNFGKPDKFSVSAKQTNPFCGDDIEIYIQWDKRDKGAIEDISFAGNGCVISTAAASILTDHIKGKTKKELTTFSENDMLGLLGIEISETRKKCALLSWSVLRDCLASV